jgi:hypothetical protein
MTKIVINKRIGGFGLSYFGLTEYAKRKDLTLYFYDEGMDDNLYKLKDENALLDDYIATYQYTKDFGDVVNKDYVILKCSEYYFSPYDISRTDTALIEIIEEFGSEKISSTYSLLKIVEIPNDVKWDIEESEEGIEWISEKHRIWG